ncbi:MAG: hypothetical protein L6R41_002022 [Letrouitia leprolyta]|nr:MAG: hypothetical protein L6R41_002022 [Letrouitia leprolyta]
MSRPFQTSQLSHQGLSDQAKASLATTSGDVPPCPNQLADSRINAFIELLDRVLQPLFTDPSNPPLPEEALITTTEDNAKRALPEEQKDKLKKLLGAVHQSTIRTPSENASTSVRIRSPFETWHPINVLNEYNRLNPSQRVSAPASMFLNNLSDFPEKDRAAHEDRVKWLEENWKLPEPNKGSRPSVFASTISQLTEEERMLRDRVNRLDRELSGMYTCYPKPNPTPIWYTGEYPKHVRVVPRVNQKTHELKKGSDQKRHEWKKRSEKQDEKAKQEASTGAKEDIAEEDWVVVNDMDAIEDPFVIVYDKAKFSKVE